MDHSTSADRGEEKKEPERTELTVEHEQMYSAGTDPLALATMAAEQKQGGGSDSGLPWRGR